ncbi:Beta-glucosidase/6-phospho-beta-glucosidase/beta-galactosidase [Noviherbaspirillum humi]|uniref:Beta-glucosidase/6-phospho-beta-glucosidase/beta-galactosidase n=1 Tax=Noviherbaspirillum humi TaxID=1688639 RepID=A0A239C4Y2_9BURK|nr:b-glycosidase [Noviherbaspirillum humi]SNS15307.1 Beta-glucosidase/6-phospho-beta-glucosidase/beta-galactosidase [Noviherbaspirillum humi]
MAKRPGIFPTFFISGFECSTFKWKDQGRRNLIDETRHAQHAREDYCILHDLGIAVAREGIPWPLVDKGGSYDFGCLDPMIDAMNQAKVTAVWDLCHYGYPDDADPFDDGFAQRFADYARAAAAYVTPRVHGPHFFTPINEITFFSFCGGEWGWVAPYRNCREDRMRLRLALCRAAIAGVKAIREVAPQARMIHIDPLVYVVPPRDRPDLKDAAWHETFVDTFLAWDIIAGREHPELGGSPEVLDIVGANNYSFGQMEYREHGPHKALDPDDDRIKPLCELLGWVWNRYRRPMIIGETSGMGQGRAAWLHDVMQESLAAVDEGMDLQGICLFPAVDMPDWHTGEWLHNGICDLVEQDGDLKRVPDKDYVDELRRWQKELNRVTRLDADPFSDPVELQDVIDAAKRLKAKPDANWC